MIDVEQAVGDLQMFAHENGSTAVQGIEQDDGSILVLTSVQGETCTRDLVAPEDRFEAGWPAPEPEATQNVEVVVSKKATGLLRRR